MTSAVRTLILFGTPSLFLALWQYWRSAAVCYDGSGWSTVLWGLQLLMCGLPLVAVRAMHASRADAEATALRFILRA
jgi:hypothetical protein